MMNKAYCIQFMYSECWYCNCEYFEGTQLMEENEVSEYTCYRIFVNECTAMRIFYVIFYVVAHLNAKHTDRHMGAIF